MDAEAWKASAQLGDKVGGDPEWGKFIDHESRKRVAFFAFVVDTQHTAMFNHAPSMFISDLRFRLPCDEAMWEAPDAASWRRIRNKSPEPPAHFTTTIGAFLRLDSAEPLPTLSPWGMMIILHGLISVGWNMRLRERIIPENESTESNDNGTSGASWWMQSISESYCGWLRHYRDIFITSAKLPVNHPYVLGCLTTYELAHIVLNVNVLDSENFIKALVSVRHENGTTSRSMSALEYLAHTVADEFLSTRATYAVRHALDMIEMFIMGDKKYDVVGETAFHRTYCLYLSALTVWTFQYLIEIADRNSQRPLTEYSSESVWQQASQNSGVHTEIKVATYLGRLRGVISKLEPQVIMQQRKWVNSISLTDIVLDRKSINSCGANILLHHVVDLIRLCRWKMSKC
jgi:hypothetical protein